MHNKCVDRLHWYDQTFITDFIPFGSIWHQINKHYCRIPCKLKRMSFIFVSTTDKDKEVPFTLQNWKVNRINNEQNEFIIKWGFVARIGGCIFWGFLFQIEPILSLILSQRTLCRLSFPLCLKPTHNQLQFAAVFLCWKSKLEMCIVFAFKATHKDNSNDSDWIPEKHTRINWFVFGKPCTVLCSGTSIR